MVVILEKTSPIISKLSNCHYIMQMELKFFVASEFLCGFLSTIALHNSSNWTNRQAPSLMMTLVADVLVLTFFVVLLLLRQSCRGFCDDLVKEYYADERADLLKLRDSLSSSLDLHKNWTGPPCVGDNSSWVGVACSNWHVINLVLDGIRLRGSLPPNFLESVTFLTKLSLRNNSVSGPLPNLSGLVHLEDISLSHNHFSGPIPQEYVTLPRLTNLKLEKNHLVGWIPPFDQSTLVFFNVSHNQLDGPIPGTRILQSFPKSSFDHNPNLCGSPLQVPCSNSSPPLAPPPSPLPSPVSPPVPIPIHKRSTRARNIVLIAAAAALVPFLVMLVVLCYNRRALQSKEGSKQQHPGGPLEFIEAKMYRRHPQNRDDPERTVELEFFNKDTPIFDLDDLLGASAELLGKGNLGNTYKALLETGSVVTVKRLKNMEGLTKKDFVQQIQLLGMLKHENLAEIISFYYSKDEKLIIYEFISDCSLFELLHGPKGVGRSPLDWAARLSIIKDVAKGLIFLHQSLSSQRVPHANLKSSNVLIHRVDEHYHAKLVNFGFFPLLATRKLSKDLVLGKTPEFLQNKKLTHRSDVYCFGILILEIITGKIPGEVSPGMDETFEDLSEWVRMVVNNDWSTDILDAEMLAAKEGHDEMLKLTEIALECTDAAAEKRPRMNEVLRRIEEIEQKDNSD